jgi:hypothetical protein
MIRRLSLTALVLLLCCAGRDHRRQRIVAILVALGVVDKPITNFAALGTAMIVAVWGGLLLLVAGTVLLATDGIARKGARLFLSGLIMLLVGSGPGQVSVPPASVSPPIQIRSSPFGIWHSRHSRPRSCWCSAGRSSSRSASQRRPWMDFRRLAQQAQLQAVLCHSSGQDDLPGACLSAISIVPSDNRASPRSRDEADRLVTLDSDGIWPAV